MSASSPDARPKIALLAPYSFGNLGNAALQRALIERFSGIFPAAELLGCYVDPAQRELPAVTPFPFHRDVRHFAYSAQSKPGSVASANPAATEVRKTFSKKLKSIALVARTVSTMRSCLGFLRSFFGEIAFLRKAYKFAGTIDLFIVGGGGQLDDLWGGPWSLPYSLFTWALLAKLHGKRLLILNVGAESITTATGRWFLGRVLAYSQFHSFRDAPSRAMAVSLGSPEPNPLSPDLAFSLAARAVSGPRPAGPLVVGISPMSYGDPRYWPAVKVQAFLNYTRVLAKVSANLANSGHSVVLFPTQIRMDATLIEEIYCAAGPQLLPEARGRLRVAEVGSLNDCLELLPALDLVLASRFHGVLLPMLTGIPIIAISAESKLTELLADFGVSQFQIPFESVTVSQVEILFDRIQPMRSSLRDHFLSHSRHLALALDEQFSFLQESQLQDLIRKFPATFSRSS